jgi:hypothetical protein
MLQFEIYCALCSGKNNVNGVEGRRNFIDLSDILERTQIRQTRSIFHNRSTHLAHESIQEHLPHLVAICVPLWSVYFPERMELLNSYEE